jgi:hypothetical protein
VLFTGAQESPDRLGNSFNGARTTSTNFAVNGVDANDPALNTVLVTPSPDAIQEFRLITNTMNPEYGRNAGGLVEAVTKSGTNSFHGSLFYVYRNKGLNARSFFDAQKPDFNQNQWGGTIGGPIWKKHTFFFLDYLGLKNILPFLPSLSPNNPQVFSPDERGGNFANSSVVITDPVTGRPRTLTCGANGGFPGTAPDGTPWNTKFPNCQIPVSSFNPISAFYLNKFIPLPNLPGNHFRSSGSSPGSAPKQFTFKADHNWTRDTLTGSYFGRHFTATRPFPFTGANVFGFGDLSDSVIRQLTVTYNHTFSSRVVNEARFGYTRLNFHTVIPDPAQPGNKPPSFFGFTGITPQIAASASSPKINIGSGNLVLGFSNNGPQPRLDSTYQWVDNFSWLKGRHNFKFGADFRKIKVFSEFLNAHNGVFDFLGTGDNTTSNVFADFLLGVPDDYAQGSGSTLDARDQVWYLYAQDVVRATSSLTLTYGIGWTYDPNWENVFNNKHSMIAFRPGCHSQIYPTAPVGICYTGDAGIGRGTAPSRKHNFGPRFGFAWSPSAQSGILHWLTGGPGNFVIRGGYGIYRDNIIGESTLQFLGNPPIGATLNGVASPSFANPFVSINGSIRQPNPFPVNTAPPIGSPVDFSIYFPFSATSFDPNFRYGYLQSFNLTFEREIRGKWLIRTAYVGSLGRNLLATYEGNPVDSARAAALRCGANFTQAPVLSGRNPLCATVTRFISGNLVPSISVQGSFANSSYHSFQTTLEKRMSHGISFQAAYTLSKSLDNSNGLEGDSSAFQTVNPFNPKLDKSFSEFDARQRLVLSYIWDFPFRKTGLLGKIIGGWGISGVSTFASGFPVLITDTSDRCLVGRAVIFFDTYCRPNLVGPITIFDPRANAAVAGNITNDRGVAPANAYFNPTAFTRVPANSGLLGNAARSNFHGPGFNNFNISVSKKTNVTERVSVGAHADFFNAFNHAQFSNPSGNVNSVNFGRVSNTRVAGRIIQLGLNLAF